MGRDATVVGVVAEKWCKGAMRSDVEPQYYRTTPLSSRGAGAGKCSGGFRNLISRFLTYLCGTSEDFCIILALTVNASLLFAGKSCAFPLTLACERNLNLNLWHGSLNLSYSTPLTMTCYMVHECVSLYPLPHFRAHFLHPQFKMKGLSLKC